ncbi:DNA-binding protein REB1-like [Melanaphis sacchari]|uniref:DNA-binding protein REB1-like n=1 Tax=Melanaphis sacchari TaxID=742174 RepID=UPI000DC156C7|nr:DNA-binding protein REB1-like [Melanaphis sacchari]
MSSINIDVRRPLSSYTAVCRVCMKENTNDNSNKFHDIYIDKINSVDIHELLVTMLKIVIDPEDLRPKLICGECYNKITEWHNMIFQAQLSQFCVDQIFSRKKVNIDDHTQQAITSSTSAISASNNENKDNSNNNPSTSSASFISAPNNDDENYSNKNSSTPSTYVFSASDDDDDDDKDPSAYVINVSDDDDNDYLNNSPSTSPAYVISASDDDNDKDPSTPSAYVISASDDDNDKDPSTPSHTSLISSDNDDNDYSNNNPSTSSAPIISASHDENNSNNNPSTSSAPIISASRDKNNSNKNPTSNLAHNTDDDTAKIFYLMPSTSADGTHTHVINDKIDVGQREHYSCIIPSCRSFYRTFKGFKIHYRRHRKVVNSVVCWKCNNTFPNMSVMRSHQFNRSCMFPGMFTCALCPKKFDDLESLSIHKYVEHVNNQPKWLCLKVFNS